MRAGDFGTGLNPAQWEALRYLLRANRFSKTPAALADYLNATRGTVSQTLIALEEKGLIEKTKSEKDARSFSLTLTEEGRKMLTRDSEGALARDIDRAGKAAAIASALEAALGLAIRRRGGREFGACKTCRHFRRGTGAPGFHLNRCAHFDEPLTAQDAEAICVAMEAA